MFVFCRFWWLVFLCLGLGFCFEVLVRAMIECFLASVCLSACSQCSYPIFALLWVVCE